VLDVSTLAEDRLAEATLVNPAYQSWAPDGSALVFINGGYRSAQVNKWLSLYEVASGQVITLVPEDELVPGQVAWSPAGDAIAFAAVEASQTGDEWAEWMGWDNPAIEARRIYLLDPQSGGYQQLNAAEAYQDAPRWSADGKTLYYVQMQGDQVLIMAADPASGEAQPLPGCQAARPSGAGYYGQVDWTDLYENCPEARHFAHYRGPNPYRSTPSFDVQYDQAVWEYVEDGISGRRSQLVHRDLPGCVLWLQAGPVGARLVTTTTLADYEWKVSQVQSNVLHYSTSWSDIWFIFGLTLPGDYSEGTITPCQQAAEGVISTFSIVNE
jgi:dipeptidyl aminopeptidase/acylaminoacyl peptidase